MTFGLAALIRHFDRLAWLAKQRDHEIQSNIANGDCFPAPLFSTGADAFSQHAPDIWTDNHNGGVTL
jgi:hypothetical protein